MNINGAIATAKPPQSLHLEGMVRFASVPCPLNNDVKVLIMLKIENYHEMSLICGVKNTVKNFFFIKKK